MEFQREEFSNIFEEAEPLLSYHWHEVAWNRGKIPLAIDQDIYMALEKAGKLVIFTAREEGMLVGYAAFILSQNLHYRLTKFATNDVIFITQEMRGRQGHHLVDFSEIELKKLGVQVISYHVKHILDWGTMLKRKGYQSVESVWLKWTGE